MDPGVRAQAEALLKSGKMAPADAQALRAALQLQDQEDGAPDPNEARAGRLDQAQQQFEDETSPWGLIKGTASAVGDKLASAGRGAGKLLYGALSGDLERDLVTDPSKRREVERGVSDTMFGLPAAVADGVSVMLPNSLRHGTTGKEPATLEETEESDAAKAPDYRTQGQVIGMGLPGPARMIGGGSARLARTLPIPGPLQALVAAQLASAGMAAGNVNAEGNRAGAAFDAASDPVNLVAPAVSAAAGGVRSGGRKLASAMRDDTSALGGGSDTLKQLDSMRARGAVDGSLVRTVNDPELNALPRGKKGYVKAAQNARDTIGGNTATDLKGARSSYAAEMDKVLAEHGDQPYSMEGPQSTIDRLRAENTVNGEPVDEARGRALDKAQRMITVKSPESAGNPLVANASARESTVGDMLKVKRAMDQMAEWGMPATPENRPYRIIAKEFAKHAEGIDPRIKDINAKYSGAMDKLEETNDILYGQDAPQVADRPAARRRAAGKLMRAGDDTTSGELGEEDIDRLAQLDERNARPIQTLKDKKAIERTRFGMPNMSKSPEKWGVGLLEQNLEATRARVVDPFARAAAGLGMDPVMRALARARAAAQERERR